MLDAIIKEAMKEIEPLINRLTESLDRHSAALEKYNERLIDESRSKLG